jgi:sialate O-acetylesterase
MRTRPFVSLAVFLALALPAAAGEADVELAGIFGDHMVLQREMELPVWGRATPGETVTVTLARAKAEAKADDAGRWRVVLPAMAAGGPHTLTATGADADAVAVDDVWIGEVWLCSGQSNMEWPVRASMNAAVEIRNADRPMIRQFTVPHVASATPRDDVPGSWAVCTPASVGTFTACGYFMAVELQRELGVAIGLVSSNWGGTRIEPWTAPVGFEGVPSLRDIADAVAMRSPDHPTYRAAAAAFVADLEAWTAQARRALAAGEALPPKPEMPAALVQPTGHLHQEPVMLYNAMIRGLVGYPMRGAIWYQGESNHGEGRLYADKMRALIEGWRAEWDIGAFPFYFVQLAPFRYGNEDPHVLPELWEAQAEVAREMPNCGMVVINDIATLDNIHPPNKQDVGLRLANLALRRTYGKSGIVDSGPTLASFTTRGNTLRVTFENTAGGLKWRDGKPGSHFEIIGPGSGWQVADAKISGSTVVLSHRRVKAPTAVRFAWHKLAEPNLINGAGLPTGAFRAGAVPRPDALGGVAEAKRYTLVYDLDLKRLGATIAYDVDDRSLVTSGFDRIAYLVELESADGTQSYVWVSMDAFSDDLGKIGVPTAASGAKFAVDVGDMSVVSNVPAIANGRGLRGGSIEFWPNNYGPANGANVPGAAGDVYDFGDQPGPPREGYGSMQVHDHEAKRTLLAINHWSAGARADLGIGNSDGRARDWTFAANAGTYTSARLRVFVRAN